MCKTVKTVDDKMYSEPTEIAVPLAHTDFYLDYFKANKPMIFGLRSGMMLSVNNRQLISDRNNVCAVFSKKQSEAIETYRAKGYTPYAARIKFIVAWKCKDDGVDYPVPLVDLFFRK
ncbi:MAG: hypothetical protein HDT43_13535 [Ruminococcaceae bacterium]|nr:hypothetical protein [Oscillospiraceae bacterium]